MTSTVLLFVFLLPRLCGSVASWSCSPESLCSQEDCMEIHADDEDCYSAIVDEGSFGKGDDCVSCSTSVAFGSLPPPSNLTLSRRPYDTTHFELIISWNPPSGAEKLEGYKIYIYGGSISTNSGNTIVEEEKLGCHCAGSNDTEKRFEIVYSYQNLYQMCAWNSVRPLKVEVISVPYSSVSVISATRSIPWPTDCLSIDPPDYAICGPPIPSTPEVTIVTELLSTSPDFMAATFKWKQPDNAVPGYVPSEYYIHLGTSFLNLESYRVVNATNITIFPLNATESYAAYIQVYLPCVFGNQICSEQLADYSCGNYDPIGLVPTPSSPTMSTAPSYDNFTTSNLPPSSSVPLTLSTSHPLSSLPLSSSTGVTVPTGEPLPETVRLVLVVGGACLASIFLVVVLFVVTLLLVRKRSGLCTKDHRGLLRISASSPTESERSTPINFCIVGGGETFGLSNAIKNPKTDEQPLHKILRCPSPGPGTDTAGQFGAQTCTSNDRDNHNTAVLSGPTRYRVVFIYSDQTPKEDCDLIAVYRRMLESQGDITTSVYDISYRQPTSTWLAAEVQVANAIFCVCNKEFLSDWQNGGGCLNRSPVHALKLQVDSFVNSRLHPAMLYAVVVLLEKDIQFVPEGSYLKAAVNFHLCEDKLEEILRFIRQEQEYILPS